MAITEVVRKEWRNKAIRRNELAETYFIKEDYFHGLKIFVDALNYAVSSEDSDLPIRIEKNFRYHLFRLCEIEWDKLKRRGQKITDENKVVLLSEYTPWFVGFSIFLEEIIS
ncbi:hypothetical protein J4414_02915 [Candidatus Woesearchaeota archaeon]|nr:hypothetical protein [Candidatus Woesearchaeota archaeon]